MPPFDVSKLVRNSPEWTTVIDELANQLGKAAEKTKPDEAAEEGQKKKRLVRRARRTRFAKQALRAQRKDKTIKQHVPPRPTLSARCVIRPVLCLCCSMNDSASSLGIVSVAAIQGCPPRLPR